MHSLFENGLNALFHGRLQPWAQADAQKGGQQLRLALGRGGQEQMAQQLELVLIRRRLVDQLPVLACGDEQIPIPFLYLEMMTFAAGGSAARSGPLPTSRRSPAASAHLQVYMFWHDSCR